MGKYILNPETLLYEIKEVSLKSKVFKGLLLFAGSVAMAVLYLWLFTSVLGYDLPKTAFLKAGPSPLGRQGRSHEHQTGPLRGGSGGFEGEG